jgi:hypothetical protein
MVSKYKQMTSHFLPDFQPGLVSSGAEMISIIGYIQHLLLPLNAIDHYQLRFINHFSPFLTIINHSEAYSPVLTITYWY